MSLLQPYPGVPYYNGCIFSNGPPYPVVAADILNMSLTDYAKGGATSGAVPAVAVVPAGFANNSMPVSVEIPSTMEQVSRLFHNCCKQCTGTFQ